MSQNNTSAQGITAVPGFKAIGLSCEIKKNNRPDLALVYSEYPATTAALFTKNRFPAAPIQISKQILKKGLGQALICNSGNANAFTGLQGKKDARKMISETAKALNLPKDAIFVASTGVIGEPLPIDKIVKKIPTLVKELSSKGGLSAATAILTTDTCEKTFSCQKKIDGKWVHVGGMAKGSGMIHPNMATMLSFLSTDVEMPQALLQRALRIAVDASFHCITVDRDTSTNDMVLLFANGQSKLKIIKKNKDFVEFCLLLQKACLALAKMMIKDGEGATKLVEIEVIGAQSHKAAKKIAFAIAESLLVKTALFGEDANWGRIVAAIGNAGVPVKEKNINLNFGKYPLLKSGEYLGSKCESLVSDYLKQNEICISLDFKEGKGFSHVWTTDLSYDYIKINGDYRT